MYRRGRVLRTVVVTGSGSGLGAAVRARFESEGCRVIGVDLEDQEVCADLGTPRGRAKAMNAVLELTHHVIDGLVLCAGLGPDEAPPSRLVSVNYFGTVEVLDGLRPCLAAGTAPSAVAVVPNAVGINPVTDTALVDAMLDEGEAVATARAASFEPAQVHVMSKLAVVRAVRVRSFDWGQAGVRLNALARGSLSLTTSPAGKRDHPAYKASGEVLPVPLDRPITAEDLAGTISFLVGGDAGVVHGSVLFADGGTDALLRPDRL